MSLVSQWLDPIEILRDLSIERHGSVAYISDRPVGAMIDQELDALIAAVHCCMMERSHSLRIGSIDGGASIEKELDALMMATQ